MSNDAQNNAKPETQTPTGLSAFFLAPLTLFRTYRRSSLSPDLVAGLTVAAIAIPQAIAYASIANLPPDTGLYTAGVAAIVGSLWGSSRYLSTGPTNATSLLVLSLLLPVAAPDTPEFLLAAGVIAVLAGTVRLVLAFLRFGALVTLASRSVLVGFAAGAAVLIAVGQLRPLLHLDIEVTPDLYRNVIALTESIGLAHLPSLALGAATVVLIVVITWLSPRAPATLLAIVGASVVVWLLGAEANSFAIVGHVPRSLPPFTWQTGGGLPDFEMIRALVLGSTAVAALGLVESSASAQTLARRAGQRLDQNQEFFGQGLANVVTGLLSGYACSGSLTRSSLAYHAGAKTRLSGAISGVVVLIAMLLFAPLAGQIPKAALAGVIFVVAYEMVDRAAIARVFKTSKTEAAITAATFIATLTLPLEFAILTGVVLSLAFFIVRSSLPRVYATVPDESYRHCVEVGDQPSCPQLGVVTIRGPLFFGATYHIEEELRHHHEQYPGQSLLAIRMEGVDICDLSGVEALEATLKTYRKLGGDLFLIKVRKPVLAVLQSSGFIDTLGGDHILDEETAVEHLFEEVLDPIICVYECEHRVFAECQGVDKHLYENTIPPFAHAFHRHHEQLIDLEQFTEHLERDNALVLDVREPDEYARCHIPGSRLLPLRLLSSEASSLGYDRPILLISRSGRRSLRAQPMLHDLGFADVHGLAGGILAWRAAELPLVVGDEEEPGTALPVIQKNSTREKRTK